MLRELGHFERALTLTNEYSPFNVVSVLQIRPLPSQPSLELALRALQKRHPLLHAFILKEHKRYYYKNDESLVIPVEFIERLHEDHWKEVVEGELNRKLDISAGPLLRVACLRPQHPGTTGEIIMTHLHAIIDAPSIANLWQEFAQLVAAYESTGEDIRLPALPVQPPAEAFYPPQLKGMSLYWQMLRYALLQMGDELQYYWRARGRRKPPVRSGGQARVLTMQCDAGLTDAIIRACRQNKITANCLLNAAMLLAANRKMYQNRATPMRTFSFADLRPYVAPPISKEHLGSNISMLRYSITVPGKRGIWDLAQELQDKMTVSFERGDKYIAPLVSETLMKALIRFKAFRMGSTALSFTGTQAFDLGDKPFRITGLHGFISNIDLGPEFTAQVHLFSDRFFWDMVYLDTDMDRESAQGIADEILIILQSAIESSGFRQSPTV